ncbi:MAG TPA: beta-L-arabinofuranosidase domain-containing protein [Bryobacteraceae bacterium]|nr:beta-L-arabinofuranosidase domain-containing protein [Bryobacteraceae bacterium]
MRASGITRRTFSATAAAAPALAQVAQPNSGIPAAAAPQNRVLVPDNAPFDAPLRFTTHHVGARSEPFPMGQVRLLPGSVYADARDWNRGYIMRLEADRLLYTFRVNAGLPTGAAKPLGGWEQPENGQRSSELRGHFMGHYLSAVAQLATSGDREAQARGDYIVAELAKCQAKLGGKYLSAYPTTWFDRLGKGERVWAPFYTIHKIMAGLYDMYRLGGNRQALQTLEGMAAWADEWTAQYPEERMQQILTIEFGGIAETLYHLAAATGDDRWGAVGDRFQKRTFINPLAARRDELRGLHANTHIPQAIAAARRYELTGDARFHDVADFFFYTVSSARAYATGGTSNRELWLAPPRRLAAEWKLSANTAECCCAYNMLKLARQLYSWNPDPAYFDYYERVLLNHRIGTIRPGVGHAQYYLSLTPGVWKTFGTEDQTFWCCTGSGVEEYSKLNDSIYWRDDAGVYVNLFVPSELDWAERGFRLRQDTRFPDTASTSLTIAAARPGAMTIRLRVPGWLQIAPAIRLNGNALESSAAPGSYVAIRREWKAGDRIDMELPMRLHIEAMPDDPTIQAFLYGPLVLAGDLGNAGLTEAHITGPNLRVGAAGVEQWGSPLAATNSTPPIAPVQIPAFQAKPAIDDWIKPDGALTFRTTGQKHDVKLVRLNQLFDRRYSVYWQVT